jgi:RNA polymerase sigma-70 factor, ECF subfamily
MAINAMAIEHVTEIETIKQVKYGNSDAFSVLVSNYQKQIYYLAYGILGNHHLAEDISQETFLRLWKTLRSGSFDEAKPVYPWIRTICINLARDILRNKKRYFAAMKTLTYDNSQTQSHEEHESVYDTKKITHAIASLPHDKREILMLRVVEGMSYKEISNHLDCSIGTVMSRLFRARLDLKALLEQEG